MSQPNPFIDPVDHHSLADDGEKFRQSKHTVPAPIVNPYLTGINPATGLAPYGVGLPSPLAAQILRSAGGPVD